jgi:hypothetical protein
MGDKENGKNGDRLTNKEYTKELRSLQAELWHIIRSDDKKRARLNCI